MTNNTSSKKSTRRAVLKTMGATSIAAAGVSGTAVAAKDDSESFVIPAEDSAHTEIKELREIDAITVTENNDTYVVQVDTSKVTANEAEQRKAKKAAKAVRQKVSDQVDQSVNAVANQAFGGDSTITPETVSPAATTTYYNMTTGDQGGWSSGITINAAGSNYDLGADKATAACVSGTIGLSGSVTRWAWVGVPFTASQSGAANVIAEGNVHGLLTAAGSTSTNVLVEIRVKDQTTGTVFKDEILSQGGGGYAADTVDESFNSGTNLNLTGGHNYIAYVYLETSITLAGIGQAGSDFGPQDLDGGNTQGCWVDNITVSQ